MSNKKVTARRRIDRDEALLDGFAEEPVPSASAEPRQGSLLAHLNLHPRLQARVETLHRQDGSPVLDVAALLQAVSRDYESIDDERRGIVQAMHLMAQEAQEAQALARVAREQTSDHLRIILDHLKDAVLTLDSSGCIRTFNPTAERIFGYQATEILGQRIDVLIPQIAERISLNLALQRLAVNSGDTLADLAGREFDGRRRSGEIFPLELAVSRAQAGDEETFVVCLRDISERQRAESVAAAEREVFGRLMANAPLAKVLEAIASIVECVSPDASGSICVLTEDAQSFAFAVAPRLDERLRAALERSAIDVRNGSCAAAVYLGRSVIATDVAADPFWQHHRELALAAGVRASWSTPIKSASGKILGALGVHRRTAGLPTSREVEVIAHAAQLAGIAIERRLAEEALRGSEARFRGLFESIAEGVYRSSRDGRLLTANPAFAAMLGYERAEELYALPSVASLYWNAADRAEFVRMVEADGEIRNAEFCMRRRDGQQIVVLENSRVVRDAGGRIIAYEGTILDITERKRAEQAIFAEKERAQVTLQSIGDAVISTDALGHIDYMNPVAESLTGWSAAEARGRLIGEVLSLINEATRAPTCNPLLKVLGQEGGEVAEQPVLVTRTGQEVAIQESAAPICDRQGRIIGAVIVFHDVTKERRLKRALSYQASHDALTGLINRREFDARLRAALSGAQRGDAVHALLYIDLDQFKVVNDTCGHPAGDRLLRDITGLLQMRVRASDTIARLGGDEFGVLLENCTLEQATRIAESIRQSIRDYRFVWGTTSLSVGASVGVVAIDRDTESAANVMSAADIACYAAKDEGRNRVHVYDAGGVSSRHREMHWVAQVTRAVEENRLELCYQPIALIDGVERTPFHEITVRLRDESGALVPPSEFIPAAERYNIMSLIDRWVVLRVVELLQEHRRRGRPLPLLAVNLSGTSLNDQTFIDFVMQLAGESTVAGSLCFEITETAAVTNLSNVIYFMQELKSRGCKFSLDDFGSGLSSFMYLRRLPVDYLKIDGQFVGQIASDPVDRSMVEAIGKIGKALGICTVAECVETEAVLDELRRIRIDFAQGFLIARPRPVSDLLLDVAGPMR